MKSKSMVLYSIKKNLFSKKSIYKIADPGYGHIKLTEQQFQKRWLNGESKGVAMFLEPTKEFYKKTPPHENKPTFRFVFNYLTPYKRELFQLFIGLLGGSLLTLIFPFLTQALIDKGIGNQSLDIIYIILFAQIFFYRKIRLSRLFGTG